jgi:hypothetical protein
MPESSASNPQITDKFSDLQTLTTQALRRYGDFAPGSASGDVTLMFIEFANMVVDEVRSHPYWPEDTPLDYYTSPTDVRPIPDPVVLAGLLFHYSIQQLSNKAQAYQPAYARALNQQLHYAIRGNERPRFVVQDGGSRGGRS